MLMVRLHRGSGDGDPAAAKLIAVYITRLLTWPKVVLRARAFVPTSAIVCPLLLLAVLVSVAIAAVSRFLAVVSCFFRHFLRVRACDYEVLHLVLKVGLLASHQRQPRGCLLVGLSLHIVEHALEVD